MSVLSMKYKIVLELRDVWPVEVLFTLSIHQEQRQAMCSVYQGDIYQIYRSPYPTMNQIQKSTQGQAPVPKHNH